MRFIARPPILITLFLFILALQLLALRIGENSSNTIFGKVVLAVTHYPDKVLTGAARGILGFWNGYIDFVGIAEENRRLRAENLRMRSEVFDLWEKAAENERLHNILGIEKPVKHQLLPANVIASSPSILRPQVVVIDRGTRDGVSAEMAVVAYGGIVGRVFTAGFTTSEVVLITDGASAVDAYVHRTRARGIVKGKGAECVMEYIEKDTDVTIGDRVAATGKDGFYPKGLEIGTVYKVKAEGEDIKALIMPSVDLDRLEEVLIILRPPVYSILNE